MNAGMLKGMDGVDGANDSPILHGRASAVETNPALETVASEDQRATVQEVLPNTLRWLYALRIALYVLAAGLALGKVILSGAVLSFLLDLVTDTPAARHVLENWAHALQLLVSGGFAASLSLAVGTFLVQSRIGVHARRESARTGRSALPEKELPLILRTLEKEAVVALLTGLLTFALSELLAPGATGTAAAFGLLAGAAAGGLDTLFFHLLFLLRDPPLYASEKHYREGIEQTQARLADGSMRLPEALIGRFEADYRRTAAATQSAGGSRRQLQEARRHLKARMWVIDRVVPRNHLMAFTAEAREDPSLLERWTEEIDLLVNASIEVQRRQGFLARVLGRFQPSSLARQTALERNAPAAKSA